MIAVGILLNESIADSSDGVRIMNGVGVLFFTTGLLAACIMDRKEQMVYRFLWLWSGLGAVLLMAVRIMDVGVPVGSLVELGLFMVIQQVGFARFYGRADCHAYCVCAVAMAALGLNLQDYVIHMLITFVILAAVQLIKRNVEAGGRLKKPVALIPYITVALWLWVDFRCGKWYI